MPTASSLHLTNAPPQITPLTTAMLEYTKSAYSVRRIPHNAIKTLITGELHPRRGDVVLAEIVRLGQHQRIELTHGRCARLHPGDRVILVYDSCHAADQFEAHMPDDLGPCHMVAASGIAARQHNKHSSIKDATEIQPLGLLGNGDGQPLNLADWGLPPRDFGRRPLTLAVLGTTMDTGKTSSAACLIRGLRRAWLRVGAARLTGAGGGGDTWLLRDSGAEPVLDFTDAGHASTFGLSPQGLRHIAATLTGHLVEADTEVIVLEIGNGLLQRETAILLTCDWFRKLVDGIVFTAGDALSAKAGIELLQQQQLPVLAVSGSLTASPMAMAEARRAVSCPVLGKQELGAANVLEQLGLVGEPNISPGLRNG